MWPGQANNQDCDKQTHTQKKTNVIKKQIIKCSSHRVQPKDGIMHIWLFKFCWKKRSFLFMNCWLISGRIMLRFTLINYLTHLFLVNDTFIFYLFHFIFIQ